MSLAIPPLESEPEPEPNPEVPKPAPGTKLGLDVPNPVPAPGRSPTMTDLESFFGSLSLPVSLVAALADKLGIGGASDFKEFSEHELVEEHGFEVEHIRKIFGALGPEEASADSMAASSDPSEPVLAPAPMQPSPTSKAQHEAGAVGGQSLRKGSPGAHILSFLHCPF